MIHLYNGSHAGTIIKEITLDHDAMRRYFCAFIILLFMLTPPASAQQPVNPTVDVTCTVNKFYDGSIDTIDHSHPYKLDSSDPASGRYSRVSCSISNDNNFEVEVEIEHNWDLLGSIPQQSPITIPANDEYNILAKLTSDPYEKQGTFEFTYSATITEYLGISCDDCETTEDSVSVEVVKWTAYRPGIWDESGNYHSVSVQPDISLDWHDDGTAHGVTIVKPCSNQLEFEYFWPFYLDGNVETIEVTFAQNPAVFQRTESGEYVKDVQSKIITDDDLVLNLAPGNHNISKTFLLDYKKTDDNVSFQFSHYVDQVDDYVRWDVNNLGYMASCYIDAEQGKQMEENSKSLPGFESSLILLATFFAFMMQIRKQTTDISFP